VKGDPAAALAAREAGAAATAALAAAKAGQAGRAARAAARGWEAVKAATAGSAAARQRCTARLRPGCGHTWRSRPSRRKGTPQSGCVFGDHTTSVSTRSGCARCRGTRRTLSRLGRSRIPLQSPAGGTPRPRPGCRSHPHCSGSAHGAPSGRTDSAHVPQGRFVGSGPGAGPGQWSALLERRRGRLAEQPGSPHSAPGAVVVDLQPAKLTCPIIGNDFACEP
jgi:hypothetical protein